MAGPRVGTGKSSSIRLGETVFPLWAASKDMYTSSSAKYSKFKLSHADFAEHLLRFHIENGCSLCSGDAYTSKYHNIGVQTEREKTDIIHQQWTDEICEPKQFPAENPVKIRLDHAYFRMFPRRLKNNRKSFRRRCLSLSQFQDFLPDWNGGEKENSGDDDDDETLTASEQGSEEGSEEGTSLVPVRFSNSDCNEGDAEVHNEEANQQRILAKRVQKQRDSVEGIISKIKQKVMGEEAEVVAVAAKREQSLKHSENADGIIGNIRDEEDFITALYSMAASNDVQCLKEMTDQCQNYPSQGVYVAVTTQQVKKEEMGGDATSNGSAACSEGEPKVLLEQQDGYSTVQPICEDDVYVEVKEGKEKKRLTEKTIHVPRSTNVVPEIDKKQVMQPERMLQEKEKGAAEANKEKKTVKPVKISQKTIYRPHPRLEVELAKLPKMYECKMCFSHFQKSDELRLHYSEAHLREVSDRVTSALNDLDVGTSSNLLPMLELERIATELRQCKECKQYVENIKVHRRIHSAQWRLLNSHKCNTCGKAYIDNTSLNAHVISAHNQGKKCLICEQCGKQFARRKSLAVHRDTHLKEKPFRCFECGRGFTQKNNMKLHMRTHMAMKPYRCDACNKDFHHKVSLKMHQKKMHGFDWWKEKEKQKPESEQLDPESTDVQTSLQATA